MDACCGVAPAQVAVPTDAVVPPSDATSSPAKTQPGSQTASPKASPRKTKKEKEKDKVLQQANVFEKAKSVEPFSRQELSDAFDQVDLDGSGCIEEQEVAQLLDILGVNFTHKSLITLFRAIDADGDGGVTQPEFIDFFAAKARSKGLKVIIEEQIALKKMQAKQAAAHSKFERDVYIMHAMSSDSLGATRSWWLAKVLEYSDISCSGPYITRSREGAKDTDDTEAFVRVEKCAVVCLLLEANSLVTEMVLSEIRAAHAAGKRICSFYDAQQDVWEKLKSWRTVCPIAFEKHMAISMHFLSDSCSIVLSAVHDMLGYKLSAVPAYRIAGGDFDDFTHLRIDGVHWLKPEYVLSVTRGMTLQDLPSDAFEQPQNVRPCFVSYAQEDPSAPGLTAEQQEQLKAAVKRNMLGNRVFFVSPLSVDAQDYLVDYDFSEVLSMARFIILDEISPHAVDQTPYLDQGPRFLEALMAVVTGCLAPCYEHQFVEIDAALGCELGSGLNLRKYLRETAKNPYVLVNQLCGMVRRKKFASKLQSICAERVLRQALERHPLIAQALAELTESQAKAAAESQQAMMIKKPLEEPKAQPEVVSKANPR